MELNIKIIWSALAGVAQWIEGGPVNQTVTSSIPRLGHMPGLQARSPEVVHKGQPHIDVSLPLSLSSSL